jgi:hypothetical protein
MSGPRASGSQTCNRRSRLSTALLHHEVAPRADKSIRVHERHDNRQGRSPPDAFPLVARTRYGTVKLVLCLVAAKIGGRDRCIVVIQGTPVPV